MLLTLNLVYIVVIFITEFSQYLQKFYFILTVSLCTVLEIQICSIDVF
jgi:hypothetical protein